MVMEEQFIPLEASSPIASYNAKLKPSKRRSMPSTMITSKRLKERNLKTRSQSDLIVWPPENRNLPRALRFEDPNEYGLINGVAVYPDVMEDEHIIGHPSVSLEVEDPPDDFSYFKPSKNSSFDTLLKQSESDICAEEMECDVDGDKCDQSQIESCCPSIGFFENITKQRCDKFRSKSTSKIPYNNFKPTEWAQVKLDNDSGFTQQPSNDPSNPRVEQLEGELSAVAITDLANDNSNINITTSIDDLVDLYTRRCQSIWNGSKHAKRFQEREQAQGAIKINDNDSTNEANNKLEQVSNI